MKRLFVFLGPERISMCERWRTVRVLMTNEVFHVGVLRGRSVRLLYRPRGQRGFHWHAVVNDEKGRRVYSGRCFKSSGVDGTLRLAGLLDVPHFRQLSLDWFRAKKVAAARSAIQETP
jgi:hypothetical protein